LIKGCEKMTDVKKASIVLFGALLGAIALNFFLIPANVFSSGFTGIAQLVSGMLQNTALPISTGILLFVLNIPVVILAWLKIGKSFTIYSLISVGATTLFLELIPITKISDDILLNAVFGGVIAAIGIGLTLKWGASTGGMDIVVLVLSRMKDRAVGHYFFILNGLIIITAGFVFGWEKALYTLVTLYVTSRVIDVIHTRHEKLTAMIVTKKGDELRQAIHDKLVRGITMVPAKGAFTKEDKDLLIIVITRYELYYLEKIINDVDPSAFTNIVNTAGIYGVFRRE
jgi:uncharacterized membrane-anchored protein YitT (DUF2179 family)